MKRIDAAAMKRAGLVWGAGLVMFLVPQRFTDPRWSAFLHRPWVLLVGPLLLAGISLLTPQQAALTGRQIREREAEVNRVDTWKRIVACVLLILFVAFFVAAINAPPVRDVGFTHRANIFFGLCEAMLLVCLWRFVGKLRRSGAGS